MDVATLPPVYKSAVAIIPPPEVWEPIQALRAAHDRAFERWPPHINLLYGFVKDEGGNFEAAAEAATCALADMSPFMVQLAAFGAFAQGKGATLWLHPAAAPAAAPAALHARLAAAFPACAAARHGSGDGGYRPHLTVGQWSRSEAAGAIAAATASWRPLTWEVAEVCLISRAGFDDPFEIRARVPLGAARLLLRPLPPGVPPPPPPLRHGEHPVFSPASPAELLGVFASDGTQRGSRARGGGAHGARGAHRGGAPGPDAAEGPARPAPSTTTPH